MDWPWLRFEKCYQAYQRRKIVDDLNQRKLMMINALYSNSNYDGKEGNEARKEAIENLEEQFTEVTVRLYNGTSRRMREEEAMKTNPFFTAAERGLKAQGVPDLDQMSDLTQEETKFEVDIEVDQN